MGSEDLFSVRNIIEELQYPTKTFCLKKKDFFDRAQPFAVLGNYL